ncbi:DNA fragmentation factor subunit beta isoform X1 [Mesocricetus auratus]|uniref:DNA fragmentation factor subunit beta n=1 Tax=Mesocricetus auratus TaxID=10036 RepID=A0A3Q0D4M0_MESAU|nr:DNA fragmentation factor subunit beta isoform X1 [Mesocricetus auratus]
MCAALRKLKSVKLRALHSECKFGVAARSCQELLHKGCVRFQLPVSGSRLCLYEDGTEVTDDYFPGLPNDAELLLLTAGQTWQGYVSDITRFLSVFNEPHAGVIRAAKQLLSDEQAPRRQKLLADLLHHVNQNISAETREQDPSWFEGLESRFRNKSGYLRYSCESRIRGYLREVSAYTSAVDAAARGEFERVLSFMSQKLKSVKYHGSYFDRGAEPGSRLCTPEGWFSCQGPFDMDSCLSKHSINPYGNRESRILFSTWNLDHIEEAHRGAHTGWSHPGRAGGELGVLLPSAFHRREPEAGAHRLPQEDHSQAAVRPQQDLPAPETVQEEVACSEAPVTHTRPSVRQLQG